MDAIETFRIGTRQLEILQDECPTSPREWDNIGTIATFEDYYTFNESKAIKGYEFNYFKTVIGYLKKYYNAVFVFPLCEWNDCYNIGRPDISTDSIIGAIYTTRERIIELCGDDPKFQTKEFILNAFEEEITELNQWANYEVYGYFLYELRKCECCGHESQEIIESVWGYYGFDYAREQILKDTGFDELINGESGNKEQAVLS
jgi:hypothetical protein